MAKKTVKSQTGTWRDLSGDKLTWEELIEEVLLARATLRNYELLLYRNKCPVRDCANASYQAKKEIYGWQKSENKPEAAVIAKKMKTKKKSK